jgi:hypothetical protein
MKSTGTSTRDTAISEPDIQTEEPEAQWFDYTDPQHCQQVKDWCKMHWEATIKKSMVTFNPMVYHECCFCFSKRGFSKNSNHRPLESSSILRIPTIKNITGHEGLFKWIISKAKSRSQNGLKTLFPAINRYHIDQEEEDDTESHQVVYLAKRTEDLAKELHNTKKLVESLSSENKRLLDSSKNWYARYQEATSQEEHTTDWNHKLKTHQAISDLIN